MKSRTFRFRTLSCYVSLVVRLKNLDIYVFISTYLILWVLLRAYRRFAFTIYHFTISNGRFYYIWRMNCIFEWPEPQQDQCQEAEDSVCHGESPAKSKRCRRVEIRDTDTSYKTEMKIPTNEFFVRKLIKHTTSPVRPWARKDWEIRLYFRFGVNVQGEF